METIHEVALVDAPVQFSLSFKPFIQYLRAQHRKASSGALDQLYAYLIGQFESAVTMMEQPAELRSAARLKAYFQLATVVVLPLVSSEETAPYAFGLPMPLRLYHASPAFDEVAHQFPEILTKLTSGQKKADRERFFYRQVLEKCYGISLPGYPGPSVQFERNLNGLSRYYQLDVNISFIEPHATGDLPPLRQAWIDFANGTLLNLPETNPLPLSAFTFEGFSFFRIEDVTERETVRQLQAVFTHLQSDPEAAIYQQFEKALRDLCGQPDLQISLTPLPQVNGSFVQHPDLRQRSIFFRYSGASLDGYQNEVAQQTIKTICQRATPLLFPDLAGLPDQEREGLYQQGIRSFLVYPITMAGQVLGILEMSSPNAHALDEVMLLRIERVLPLIQELLRYQLRQFDDALEQIVRRKFTSLQPAVRWKFYQVAWEELRLGRADRSGATPVRFAQVYPFYGAVDIRDSSITRHQAIRQDLTDQLAAIGTLLGRVNPVQDPARQEHVSAEHQRWQVRLTAGLKPEDELDITQFLMQEVHPYFRYLLPGQAEEQGPLNQYFIKTDPDTGQFNQALKRYERSMDWINATVNEYIDQEEKKLQTIYPHYFERYRTDGTEYTMYVGQSIAPALPFDPAIRQQLCAWQVGAMVEMARLTNRLLPLLPLPLRTTQLILAHTHPVDIAFRQDERRFDVEGSYSIRYEVLKKRIDKVLIDGTPERLTQPGTIAIVYSHSAELVDYLPVIESLQQQGILATPVDYFDLEPLQGISSLRAIRLQVNYATDSPS